MAYFKARVGGKKIPEPDWVWTNPSPTSNFSGQTIPVDLTTYKYFIIDFKMYNAAGNGDDIIPFYLDASGDWDTLSNLAIYVTGILINTNYYKRRIGISRSGTVGIYISNNSGIASGSETNKLVPVKIYGFKNPIFVENEDNLLWELPNAISTGIGSFAIPVDLDQYDHFMIKFKYHANQSGGEIYSYVNCKDPYYSNIYNQGTKWFSGLLDGSGYPIRTAQLNYFGIGGSGLYANKGLVFDNGSMWYNNSGGNASNTSMIPLKVYGYKDAMFKRN